MPPRYHRVYWQLAQQLHEQLTNPAAPRADGALPENSWDECLRLARLLQRARDAQWQTATQTYRQRLASAIEDLKYDLAVTVAQCREEVKLNISSAPEIYRDLVDLATEFTEVGWNPEEQRLSVTTGRVRLENFDFGPFRIDLHCRTLCNFPPFRVIALEPSPAGANSAVTHPHVSDEMLCLGAGRQAVSDALASGRLQDFFMIVDRLLHTYARGQAYVELDDWQGISCIDCGSVVDEDDRYGCDRCEEVVCIDCYCLCPTCESRFCAGCTTSCQHCEQLSCRGCLAECAQCSALLCPDCFSNPDTCQKCHEKSEDSTLEPDPTDPENAAAPLAAIAVPTDGLGQTELLSRSG